MEANVVYLKQLMNNHIQSAKKYYISHKKDIIMATTVTVSIILVAIAVIYVLNDTKSKVVYQPANACDLFTPGEAKELLGNATIHSGVGTPVVSGNTASSNCGYTDGNADTDNLIVAAIIVRSGINDMGVEQNKNEFKSNLSDNNIKVIENMGDSAFFNQERGQLNILDGRKWIILSYGPGSAPETNTVENVARFAQKIIVPKVMTGTF